MEDWTKQKLEKLQREINSLPPGTVKTESVETISPGKIYWHFRNDIQRSGLEEIEDYEFDCMGVFKTIDEEGYYEFETDGGSIRVPLEIITEYISDGFIYEVILTEELLSLIEEY